MARRSKRLGNFPEWVDEPIFPPEDLSPEDRAKYIQASQMMAAHQLALDYGIDPFRPGSAITLLMRIGPDLFPAFRVGKRRRKLGRPRETGRWELLQAIELLRVQANSRGKKFDVSKVCVDLSRRGKFKGRKPASLETTYYATKKELDQQREWVKSIVSLRPAMKDC
jgi:hypothetical protein